MNIAENSLHLLIARLAWATQISPRPGVQIPWYDYTSGFNVQPKPFIFDLKPRSLERQALINSKWESSKDLDPLRAL